MLSVFFESNTYDPDMEWTNRKTEGWKILAPGIYSSSKTSI